MGLVFSGGTALGRVHRWAFVVALLRVGDLVLGCCVWDSGFAMLWVWDLAFGSEVLRLLLRAVEGVLLKVVVKSQQE